LSLNVSRAEVFPAVADLAIGKSDAAQTKAVDRDNNASLDAANLSSSNNENNSDSLLRVDALKMKK